LWCNTTKDDPSGSAEPFGSYEDAPGNKEKPLFSAIKPSMVMLDLLHLLLRVGDQVYFCPLCSVSLIVGV
jgi:hypothetical protein